MFRRTHKYCDFERRQFGFQNINNITFISNKHLTCDSGRLHKTDTVVTDNERMIKKHTGNDTELWLPKN